MNKIIKHRKIIIMSFVVLSILFGVFIYSKLNSNNIEFLVRNANNLRFINYKTIIFHLFLLSFSFLLSFIGIGIIFLLIYLFFEGVTIGFIFAYFISLYHIKGFFFFLIYFLIFKAFLLFLITILILKFSKLVKTIYKYIKKQKVDITKTVVNTLFICIGIILNDIFLTLVGQRLLNIFLFIIK